MTFTCAALAVASVGVLLFPISNAQSKYFMDNDNDLNRYFAFPMGVCLVPKPVTEPEIYVKYDCSLDETTVYKQYFTDSQCESVSVDYGIASFPDTAESPCGTPLFSCDGRSDGWQLMGFSQAQDCDTIVGKLPVVTGCFCDTAASSYHTNCTNEVDEVARSIDVSTGIIREYDSSANCSGNATNIVDTTECQFFGQVLGSINLRATLEECTLPPTPAPTCQYVSLNWESEVEELELNASASDALLVRIYLNEDDQEAQLIPVPLLVADELSHNITFMPSVPYPINLCMPSQNEYFIEQSFRFICGDGDSAGTRKPFLQTWSGSNNCNGTASHSKYGIDALLKHYHCDEVSPPCGFVTVEEQYFAVINDVNDSMLADDFLFNTTEAEEEFFVFDTTTDEDTTTTTTTSTTDDNINCNMTFGEAIETVYRASYAVDVCVPSGQGSFKYVCDADTQQFAIRYYEDSECQEEEFAVQDVECVNTYIPFYDELSVASSSAIILARSAFQECEFRYPTSICVQCNEGAGFCAKDTYRYGTFRLQNDANISRNYYNGYPTYTNVGGAYIWMDTATLRWVLNTEIGSVSYEDSSSIFCEVNTTDTMYDDRTNFDVERCTWRVWSLNATDLLDDSTANSNGTMVSINVLSRLECSIEENTSNRNAQDVTSIVVLSLLGIAVCVCVLGFYREYLARLERKRKLIQEWADKDAGSKQAPDKELTTAAENTMNVQLNLNQQMVAGAAEEDEEEDDNAVPDAEENENENEVSPVSSSQNGNED